LIAIIVAVAFVGCNNKTEKYEGMVFITIEWSGTACFNWDVSGPAATIGTQEFHSNFKKFVADPRFLDVHLKDLWVTWRRIDGGTRVPEPTHIIYDIFVPAGSNATLDNGAVMIPEQYLGVPFNSLFPENGGIDPETGKTEIRLEATLSYYGSATNGDKIKAQLIVNETFRYGSGCGG